MIFDDFKDFADKMGLSYLTNESMSNHTSFKIGGPCEIFAEPGNSTQICKLQKFAKENDIPFFICGNGSNLLVRDGGFEGITLHLGKNYANIELLNNHDIKCLAGTNLSQVCNYACEHGLKGMEFAYGIPGTVGGAVYMNAGAFGGEIKDVIVEATYIDSDNVEKRIAKEEMDLSYRHSFFTDKDYVITSAVFHLEEGNKEEIKSLMNEILEKRKSKQPLEFPSAGSTFKRPDGAYAAALIEECGLKGHQIGFAQVSEKHSGFIVNKGGASAADVLALIEDIKKTVKEKTGYVLEPEVKII